MRDAVRSTGPTAVPEQLGFDGMPERLFVCTPSKLTTYEDCPRRYRYAYVDRPAPPKGPPWAHNSLGASVHTALRSWYGLPLQRRRPEALPVLLKATWVSEGYRDEEQERAVFRQALQWLEDYVAGLDPLDEPVGVERVVAAKTPTLALSGRVDRIDRRGDELVIVDYKTGRGELSDDDARGSVPRKSRGRDRNRQDHESEAGDGLMDSPSEEDRELLKSEEGEPPVTRDEDIDREIVDSEAGEPDKADDRGK